MRVAGPYAEVRVGGRVAARLRDWRMTGSARSWTCRGALLAVDRYWLDQAVARSDLPVTLLVPVGSVRWVWRGVRVARWLAPVAGTGVAPGADPGVIEIVGSGDPEAR